MSLGFHKKKRRSLAISRKQKGKKARAGASANESLVNAKTTGTAPFEGLTIEEYASKRKISATEVWKELRKGALAGRSKNGQLLIFESPKEAADFDNFSQTPAKVTMDEVPIQPISTSGMQRDFPIDEPTFRPTVEELTNDSERGLPPLPPGNLHGATTKANALQVIAEPPMGQELALLLDHLSLAKEENREILRLSQDSLGKVTNLTDSIVESKDALLEVKEAQIQGLKDRLEEQDKLINRLRQQKEDVELLMLTVTKDRTLER